MKKGETTRQIEERRLWAAIDKHRRTGTTATSSRCRRLRKISAKSGRRMGRAALQNPQITAKDLTQELREDGQEIHKGSVLCVVMSTSGEQCFSGGIDGTIQSWNTPNPNIDPYDSYDPSVLRGALLGHTDAVCGLVYSGAHQRLLSCSADGTVRLWNAAETLPALTVFNENRGNKLQNGICIAVLFQE
ncbi:UNVERIFIED_CONTAM: hypothetical protein FKN15_045602 [Acipenser sinensis]